MVDANNLLSIHQALLGQEDRLLRLTTPLGEDVLLPQRVVAHDRLGRGYEYNVDCVAIRDNLDLKKLIAQPVTLWLRQPDRGYRPVHGYVYRIKRLGSDGRLTFCQMSFAPWLHFLKFRKDARIWQDKAADDILFDVFMCHPQAKGQVRFDLKDRPQARSYCTQYESDWHFVHRLMEEEGWYCYHEQKPDGAGHVLVVTDSCDRLKPLPHERIEFHRAGTGDELHKIVHWSADHQIASSRYVMRTDDYKSPDFPKHIDTSVLPEYAHLPAQLEVYEYTGAYTYRRQPQGDKQSRVKVEQWESSLHRFSGVSGVRSLQVGSWFVLDDHPVHEAEPERDRQFVVIAVEWSVENNLPVSDHLGNFPGSLLPELERAKASMRRDSTLALGNEKTGHCFNRFEVQRRKIPFRSPFEHAKPILHPQTAVVVGPANEEIYTDHLNRVKVRFRWDRQNDGDERASCWVRVSYPNAGEGWGAVHVPRVRQEVVVSFLNGDPDRPIITGRLYNAAQLPQWHTNGRLSGYKSKEYKGSGFNQLVLDDTTEQSRVQLYSTNTNAQLNLGYLVAQQGNKRTNFYGSGFSLSSDAYGAVVANKGLYLSTYGRPGPAGTQLDVTEAASQLKAGAALTKTLSDTASKAGAEPLAGQAALNAFIDSTHDKYDGHGRGGANRFKEAILLAASPSGIGAASAKGIHLHAGEEATLSSGKDTNIASGKSLLASVAEKISLFAYNAGAKLFAAKGKVEVQAQSDDLDLIAEKVVRLLSTTSRIEIHAKDEVMISAGGSFIKINASGITNGTSGKWIAQASMHEMPGPSTAPFVMPHLLKPELQKSDLEFRHLTDWGAPLAGAAYRAVLGDGSVRSGTLDALGIGRISGVPPGVSAKIEYDYSPLQASSTVSAELNDDLHELLSWMPGGTAGKGRT